MKVALQAAYDAVQKGQNGEAQRILSGCDRKELTGLIHNAAILRKLALHVRDK